MLTRFVFNPIKQLFGVLKPEPKSWQEAHYHAMQEVTRLEKLVYQLQAAVRDYTEGINKKGALAISQATIDSSVIGADEAATARFTTLGVGQAAPTTAGYRAIVGDGDGREWLIIDGGGSGSSTGPGVVFSYSGASPIQGIGSYSGLLGGAFDKRLTLYSQSFDLVIGHTSNSYCVDFVNPADGAAAQTGTLTNAPSAGNPAYWLKIKIAGNVRYIPCWS